MNNNQLNVIMWIAGIIVIAWGMLNWFSKVDHTIIARGTDFNKCIWIQEGMTPFQYLEEHGVMPECEPVTASSTVEVCHSLSYYTDHKIPARDISDKCFNEIYSFN